MIIGSVDLLGSDQYTLLCEVPINGIGNNIVICVCRQLQYFLQVNAVKRQLFYILNHLPIILILGKALISIGIFACNNYHFIQLELQAFLPVITIISYSQTYRHFYIFCLKFLTYTDEDVNDEANEIILDQFLEQASIEHQIDNHDIF